MRSKTRQIVSDTLERWGALFDWRLGEEGVHVWDVPHFGRLEWGPANVDLFSVVEGVESRISMGKLEGWAMAARFSQARAASVTTGGVQ